MNNLPERLGGFAARRHWIFVIAWLVILGGTGPNGPGSSPSESNRAHRRNSTPACAARRRDWVDVPLVMFLPARCAIDSVGCRGIGDAGPSGAVP